MNRNTMSIFSVVERILIAIMTSNKALAKSVLELSNRIKWLDDMIFTISAIHAVLNNYKNEYYAFGYFYYIAQYRVIKWKNKHNIYCSLDVENVKKPGSLMESIHSHDHLWY